jgi:hypothetical protein
MTQPQQPQQPQPQPAPGYVHPAVEELKRTGKPNGVSIGLGAWEPNQTDRDGLPLPQPKEGAR